MRNKADIEKEMEKLRAELSATVGDLSEQLSPKASVERAKTAVKEQAATRQEQVKELINQAKAGDSRAQKILAGAAAAGLFIGGLMLRRLFR